MESSGYRNGSSEVKRVQGYTMVRSAFQVAKKKPKKYDIPTEIRRLARERVGAVPSPKLIVPKKQRKKPKHKRPPGEGLGRINGRTPNIAVAFATPQPR